MTAQEPGPTGPVRFPDRRWRAEARTPRMLGLLAVFVLAAAACGWLGHWQLGRAWERAEQAAARQAAERNADGPVPLTEIFEPQAPFRAELLAREVTVTGRYDPAGQLLVPGRQADGRTGCLVLIPLTVQGADALLPVVRGWIPCDDPTSGEAATDDILDGPGAQAEGAPPAPDGLVHLTGYLSVSESADGATRPGGYVGAISSADLVNRWDGAIYSGYLVLSSSVPPEVGLVTLPPPSVTGGAGPNLQNLFYALEWWFFGIFALVLWARMVRDRARTRAETQEEVRAGDGTGGAGGIGGGGPGGGSGDGPAVSGGGIGGGPEMLTSVAHPGPAGGPTGPPDGAAGAGRSAPAPEA